MCRRLVAPVLLLFVLAGCAAPLSMPRTCEIGDLPAFPGTPSSIEEVSVVPSVVDGFGSAVECTALVTSRIGDDSIQLVMASIQLSLERVEEAIHDEVPGLIEIGSGAYLDPSSEDRYAVYELPDRTVLAVYLAG